MPTSITSSTKISLALVFTLLICTASVVASVMSMKDQIAAMRDEQWTISMEAEAALREAIANPGHQVPDPRSPGKVIVVIVNES